MASPVVLEIDSVAVVAPVYTPVFVTAAHVLPASVETSQTYVGLLASVVAVILVAAPLQTVAGELIAAVGFGLMVTAKAADALLTQLAVLVAYK